jgi:hypothetical protein
VDSAANTLTTATCDLDIAEQAVTNTAGNLTGVGGFTTCAVGDGDAYTSGLKENLAFCVEVDADGSLFNGEAGDYELIVPTNETGGAQETYYFWMELT